MILISNQTEQKIICYFKIYNEIHIRSVYRPLLGYSQNRTYENELIERYLDPNHSKFSPLNIFFSSCKHNIKEDNNRLFKAKNNSII